MLTKLPKDYPVELFWEKVHRGDLNQCWEWQAYRTRTGYGLVGHRKYGGELAHRVAFCVFYGSIPKGWMVLHRCDNRACVNPLHLFLGNNRINMLDASAKGRLVGKPHVRGEEVGTSIYTEDQILEMHRLHREEGLSGYQIAKRLGKHKQHIYDILAGNCWSHLKPSV